MLIKITKASDPYLEKEVEYKEFKTLEELFQFSRILKKQLIINPNVSTNEIMIYDDYLE